MFTEIAAFCHLLLSILTTGFPLVPSGSLTTPPEGAPAFFVVLCSPNVDLACTSLSKAAARSKATCLCCLLPFTKGPWESGRGAERIGCNRGGTAMQNQGALQVRKQTPLSKSPSLVVRFWWLLSLEAVL